MKIIKRFWIMVALLAITIVSTGETYAQQRNKRKSPTNQAKDFLKTQWWLGIRSGVNISQVNVIERFSGVNPVNYDDALLNKEYVQFDNPAFHIGMDITFYHKGFSILTFPTFYRQNIAYSSGLSWTGTTELDQYETDYEVNQSVTYIELPLAVKYDILSNKIRPFVMAGAFYSFLFDANKEVLIKETDYATGEAVQFTRARVNLNNKDEFTNNWGVLGGVGVSFDFWNIRAILDIQYRHSFESIVKAENRFRESTFSAFGEVQDDYSLQNYSASVSFVFPLRYIDSQFKAF